MDAFDGKKKHEWLQSLDDSRNMEFLACTSCSSPDTVSSELHKKRSKGYAPKGIESHWLDPNLKVSRQVVALLQLLVRHVVDLLALTLLTARALVGRRGDSTP